MPVSEGILYACPNGRLAGEVERFFATAAARCGPDAAHAYPPHVTLTGFFHDTAPDWAAYRRAVEVALTAAGPPPAPVAVVTGLLAATDFIGLTVDSPWCELLAQQFARSAPVATRTDAVRTKHRLHLSLAYEFEAVHRPVLAALATELVDPGAAVEWEVRLYERVAGTRWVLHGQWPCATLAR